MSNVLLQLSLTQLRIIRTYLIYSRSQFVQGCTQLTKDLMSTLKAVEEIIRDTGAWLRNEDSQE